MRISMQKSQWQCKEHSRGSSPSAVSVTCFITWADEGCLRTSVSSSMKSGFCQFVRFRESKTKSSLNVVGVHSPLSCALEKSGCQCVMAISELGTP